MALAGSLSLAELGAATPEAGGVYIYLRDACGKLAAFIINALAHSPRESGVGLGLVLLGIPVYLVWTRFTRTRQSA